MKPRSAALALAALLPAAFLPQTALAQSSVIPLPDHGPGATLLIPYAEVDLNAPDGRTTLFTVGNALDHPVLAHAVLWSDWGAPVHAWDIYLGPNALQSYNLRDLVAYGQLPTTGDPAGPSGRCASPIATPSLGAEALLALQQQLTGRANAAGLCSSEPRADTTLATGFLTIDVVEDCSHGTVTHPRAPGYFNGPAPLASSEEALWGDFTLADPAENFAQGFEAYSLGLSPGHFTSLWGNHENPGLRRQTQSNCSRIRYLRGGPFSATTTLFLAAGFARANLAPSACAGEPEIETLWDYWAYDESGRQVTRNTLYLGNRVTAKLEVGTDLEVISDTGFLDLCSYRPVAISILPPPVPGFVSGGIRAHGRFAIGVKAFQNLDLWPTGGLRPIPE